MADPQSVRVSGSNFDEFSKSLTAAIQAVPPDLSLQLREIRKRCFGRYGFDGMYEKMNGRTVQQILEEYQSIPVVPIAAGKVDGVEYVLYRPPSTQPRNEEGKEDATQT